MMQARLKQLIPVLRNMMDFMPNNVTRRARLGYRGIFLGMLFGMKTIKTTTLLLLLFSISYSFHFSRINIQKYICLLPSNLSDSAPIQTDCSCAPTILHIQIHSTCVVAFSSTLQHEPICHRWLRTLTISFYKWRRTSQDYEWHKDEWGKGSKSSL